MAFLLKKHPKLRFLAQEAQMKKKLTFCTFKHKTLPYTTRRICSKSFAKVNCTNCEIITFEVEKITWAPLCSAQPMTTWNVECGMWGDV
jgi:hypothetical protein